MGQQLYKQKWNGWILGLLLLVLIQLFILPMGLPDTLTTSLLTMNTIFLSIIIEALPFVLIGVLIAGFIQIFITEQHIQRWIPKNKVMSVIMACVVGALFPACECGIVPIVKRLMTKGVPLHAAMGFMLTGPLINPIVIVSTYMAFGNNFSIAAQRMIIGFVLAIVIALIISMLFKGTQFKQQTKAIHIPQTVPNTSFFKKLLNMLKHAIDEFFDMGKYLFIGALLAAFVQTFVSTKALLAIGSDVSSSILVMMGLAFILSLCSEADAFIAASFQSLFPTPAILAFLIFGPMIDLKNTIMLCAVFRWKFVAWLVFIISIIVYGSLLLLASYV